MKKTVDKKVYWKKGDKDVILRIIERYKKILNLQGWDFDIEFQDGRPGGILVDGIGVEFINAKVAVTTYYNKATIVFLPNTLKEIRDNNIRTVKEIVLHEMTHCITDKLFSNSINMVAQKNRDTIINENEGVVQKIVKIVKELEK